MQQENVVYIIALIFSGGTTALLAIFAGIRHTRPGALAFACSMLATTIYTLGYALELTQTTLSGMLFWIKVEYLGVSIIPALWIIVVLQYAGKDKWLTPLRVSFLFVIPVITLVLNYTNDYHQLYYSAVRVNNDGPFPLLSIKGGPWYLVHMAYISISFLYCSYLLLEMWWRSKQQYRRQIAVMLAGSLAPWAGNIIYLSGKSPYGLDLTSFGFMITGLIYSWGLFRYQMIELVPIARDIVFESMRDSVLVLDIQNRLVDFNQAAQNIIKDLSLSKIGLPVQEALKSYPYLLNQIFYGQDKQVELQINKEKQCFHYNYRIWPIVDRRKQVIGHTVVLIDITEQVMLLDKLRTMATIDNLTSIYNRSHFFELCKKEIERAKRYGRPISLVLIDIDYFKKINDTYGHKAGDDTLKAVVDLCRSCLRKHDIFGRYGGEEFTIFLPETSSEAAMEVAERLRKKIAGMRLSLDHAEVAVTASFGVAGVERAGGVELDELLKNADQALYRAKEAGRNRVVLGAIAE